MSASDQPGGQKDFSVEITLADGRFLRYVVTYKVQVPSSRTWPKFEMRRIDRDYADLAQLRRHTAQPVSNDSASGQPGLLGKLADRWDAIPVKGPVAALAAAIGITLALTSGGTSGTCDKDPLRGVYHRQRFQVLEKCAKVTGTIIAWRHEHDGDWHVSMVMDDPGWVNDLNVRRQHGYTVVEFVPLVSPKIKFRVGQRLELTGTKVLDLQHGNHHTTGWRELHPVFSAHEVAPPSVPRENHPTLAPPTEEPK